MNMISYVFINNKLKFLTLLVVFYAQCIKINVKNNNFHLHFEVINDNWTKSKNVSLQVSLAVQSF